MRPSLSLFYYKKNYKNQAFNSYGRRGKPPASISSANYGSFSFPGDGQAPPPRPFLKKEKESLIIIIIITTPTQKEKGKEYTIPTITILTTIIFITTIIIIITTNIIIIIIIIIITITPALPLQGEPLILQCLQLAFP